MRSLYMALITSVLLLSTNSAKAQTTPPDKLEYPGQIALVESGTGLRYVHFPTNLRLYTYDEDLENQSVCNRGCASQWPPVIAPENAKPIGLWTPIDRDDGRKQWAYKGQPVYVRYHDAPSAPTGDGVDGVWHFLEP